MAQLTCAQAADLLRGWDNLLILTHVRPDGDTVGCAAGLCRALREQGKTAHILPDPGTSGMFTMHLEGLLAPDDFVPDRVVAVDIASRSMFHDGAKPYLDRVDLTVDHHGSQEFYAADTCVDPDRAACGELIYEIVRRWGPVSAEVALPLYMAVSTDCGCFVYSNTTPACHRIAADLLDCGIDFMPINRRHFRAKSFKRMKLESMLVESMQLFDEGTMAMVTLTLDMLEQLQATEEDVDNISAFVGQVEGVKTGITVRQMEPNCCKISVRTYPADLNASEVCARLGGGGHAAAAGVTLNMGVQEACDAIIGAVRAVQASKE